MWMSGFYFYDHIGTEPQGKSMFLLRYIFHLTQILVEAIQIRTVCLVSWTGKAAPGHPITIYKLQISLKYQTISFIWQTMIYVCSHAYNNSIKACLLKIWEKKHTHHSLWPIWELAPEQLTLILGISHHHHIQFNGLVYILLLLWCLLPLDLLALALLPWLHSCYIHAWSWLSFSLQSIITAIAAWCLPIYLDSPRQIILTVILPLRVRDKPFVLCLGIIYFRKSHRDSSFVYWFFVESICIGK
jgi:hypothetical protein